MPDCRQAIAGQCVNEFDIRLSGCGLRGGLLVFSLIGAWPVDRLTLTGLLSAMIGLDMGLPQQVADNGGNAGAKRLGGLDIAGGRRLVGTGVRGRLRH